VEEPQRHLYHHPIHPCTRRLPRVARGLKPTGAFRPAFPAEAPSQKREPRVAVPAKVPRLTERNGS